MEFFKSIYADSLRRIMVLFLLLSYPCWLFIKVPKYQIIVFIVLAIFAVFSIYNKKGLVINGFIAKYKVLNVLIAAFILYIPFNLVLSGTGISANSLLTVASACSKILFFYLFVISIKDRQRESEQYIKMLIFVATAFSLIGIILFVLLALGINVPYRQFSETLAGANLGLNLNIRDYGILGYVKAWWISGMGDIIRVQSYFCEAGDFGYFLLMPFFLSLGMYQLKKSKVYLFCLFFIAAAFILTFSAGAWGSLFLPIIIYLLMLINKSNKNEFKAIVIVSIILVIAIYFINQSINFTDSFAFGRVFKGSSRGVREISNQMAIDLFRTSPVFGVGLFQSNMIAESAWVLLLAETGLIGMFLIGGIVFCWLKYCLQNIILSLNQKGINSLAGYVSLGFIANLIDFFLINNFFTYYFWFLSGLLLLFNYMLRTQEEA